MKRLATLLALLYVGSASARTFQYLYLEANEGTASGGHVAVQFDDEVFHYQYSEGLTRLTKDSRDSFEFDYRFLQNRGLHVADIAVTDDQFGLLQEGFKRQYWDQDRQFKQIQVLKNDQLLLEHFLTTDQSPASWIINSKLSLPGAGLFYSGEDFSDLPATPGNCDTQQAATNILTQLKIRLQTEHGAEILKLRRQQITESIRALSPAGSEQAYRQQTYRLSERYSDAVNGLLAIQAIQDVRALKGSVCHELNQSLTSQQQRVLQDYQQQLLKSASTLINSKRPDWGQALFVTLARLIVIQKTLDSGQWVFLDDFVTDAKLIDTSNYPNQTETLNRQQQLAAEHWQQQGQELQHNALNDLKYTDLELAANRYYEWQNGLRLHRLRFQGQQALPLKSIPLPLLIRPDISPTQLRANITILQSLIPQLSSELAQDYGYQLLTHNCVTELSANIDRAIAEQNSIDLISSNFQFVPFIAFTSLDQKYTVSAIHDLPSYRHQQLAKQYDQDFPPWVFLRESNILSAELYQYNPDDAAFLFFTDDSFLLRPVFGAVNTLTGLGQSLLGLWAWPEDDGARLSNGTRGVLMSLPELTFINIRKGSYKFAVEDTLQPLIKPGP